MAERASHAPTLIELAGPAGAGKSSLLAALRARDAAILPGVAIPTWQYFPDAARLAPTFVRFHTPFRGLLRKEMKRVLHLTTLYRVIANEPDRASHRRIFDEGPVYMLARMKFLGEGRFDSESLRAWWQQAAEQWAQTLQLVIFLDGESRALTRRIRTRAARPPVSDTRDATLIPFLDRYRRCYDEVLQAMTAGPRRPAIVRLDTGRAGLESTADRILALLGVRCP